MIKVILWDIDGTLLDFKKSEYAAIQACFALFDLGICTDEMIARYSAINRSYWERLERGEVSKQEVLEGRFYEFFSQEHISTEQVKAFNEEYQIRLGDTIFFRDGADVLVARLRSRVKQYAVTNGTKRAQKRKLKNSGLEDLLDGVFISDEIGAEKPDSRFFEAVWQEIGPCKKSEILIVGDSLTSDMLGGSREGIRCCWYNPAGQENTLGIPLDHEISNLNQVEGLLEDLRSNTRR